MLVIVVLFFKELLITSFDPLMAKAMGMNVNFYHYLLMVLLTLVAVTAMQSVGTILIVAMLITPAATAYLYANSLKTMIFISATVGASSSLLGLFIGYSFNIAAGSSIVLTAASLFVISFLISPKQKFLRNEGEIVMMRKWKVVVGSLGMLIALFIFGACSTNSKDKDTVASNEKLKVVVTNSILADITENIAKDKIDLHSIVPIGKDPHEYEPLPEDVQKTSKADLIFYNGVNLETGGNAWFTKLVKNCEQRGKQRLFCSK